MKVRGVHFLVSWGCSSLKGDISAGWAQGYREEMVFSGTHTMGLWHFLRVSIRVGQKLKSHKGWECEGTIQGQDSDRRYQEGGKHGTLRTLEAQGPSAFKLSLQTA